MSVATPTEMPEQSDLATAIAEAAGAWTQVLSRVRQEYQLANSEARV